MYNNMNPESAHISPSQTLPTIREGVSVFFKEFDFGEEEQGRTERAYRSGANAFLRFLEESEALSPDHPIDALPSSLVVQFSTWLQTAAHTGPGPRRGALEEKARTGYSPSTAHLYQAALKRLLKFWWYHNWLGFSEVDVFEANKALSVQRARQKRSVQTRSKDVPTDFGERMLDAGDSLPCPSREKLPDDVERRKIHLKTLRTRALIHLASATALRVSDLVRLTRTDVHNAGQVNGYMPVKMRKTGYIAHVVLGEACLGAVEDYLNEREDLSPWIFIQHGRTYAPSRKRAPSAEDYRRRKKGYGARLQEGSARLIVIHLAELAGYKPDEENFVSIHAFRHWHAQRLIDLGASIDQVQSVLGHARAQTTKDVYAPQPNTGQIFALEERVQSRKLTKW